MSENTGTKIKEFIANHWVSWLIELSILGVVAYFTISETRKTAEQTREMLARYDTAISKYASEKSEAVDQAVSESYESAKEKAKSIKAENVKGLINSLRKNEEESSSSENE